MDLQFSGKRTTTTFSKSFIKAFAMDTGELIVQHPMECISFASIGEDVRDTLRGLTSPRKNNIIHCHSILFFHSMFSVLLFILFPNFKYVFLQRFSVNS